jgi:hypothetical protein
LASIGYFPSAAWLSVRSGTVEQIIEVG